MLLQCLPSCFGLIPPTVREEMSFEVFQDGCHGSIQLTVLEEMSFGEFQDGIHGGHLGYGNRTILAILSLYNSPKPPIKLNLTYCLGLDII